MRPIIQVRGLSKRYRIGKTLVATPTLREALANALKKPLERLRGIEPAPDEMIWALRDVSFEVQPGEVIGVIGRNGAGKSTLLKILSRVIRPTVGEVDVYGRIGSLLEIGTGFHPELSGRENIYLNGAIIGMRRDEIKKKFDEIVAFAEVERFLDTPIKYYSSGMYLRLAFAVAAHLESEIIFLDEVLAVGDEAFRQKCLWKMKEVSRAGRTVFFVSHDLLTVQKLCGRVFLIESGQLLNDGPAEAAVTNYLKSFSHP